MISSINMSGVATFGDQNATIDNLKTVNYFFGTNGTGKTSIGRVINAPDEYPSAQLVWKNNDQFDVLVYNRDFVESNFLPSELKGVFTLGEDAGSLAAQISDKKTECDELSAKISRLRDTLSGADNQGGKLAEKSALKDRFKESCWSTKKNYEVEFKDALTGSQQKDSFMDRVLSEYSTNEANLVDSVTLKEKAQVVFGAAPMRESNVNTPVFDSLLSFETSAILQKVIVGKTDLDIAALIEKLGNSDWVNQGTAYLNSSKGLCPFCQQPINGSLKENIEAYFDETFKTAVITLNQLAQDYKTTADLLNEELSEIVQSKNPFVDMGVLKPQIENLQANMRLNEATIIDKLKNVSIPVTLTSLDVVVCNIKKILGDANAKTAAHNTLVDNFQEEKRVLIVQVWKAIVEQLRSTVDTYLGAIQSVDAAITSLEGQIDQGEAELLVQKGELGSLEAQVTSIKPTIENINRMLQTLGFTGFQLDMTKDETAYRLIRDDGQPVMDTLSDGEKNFVAFLYFFYLLEGSHTSSGASSNRIVVIDDPVSSLDSDVLFVVSSLIRDIASNVVEDNGNIKQLFIMTHNVNFHKEVSYDSKRDSNSCRSHESFWLVKKGMGNSTVESIGHNPISTTYNMLWDRIKQKDCDSLTVRNTMRRILENYFRLLGGVNLNGTLSGFTGEELAIARSLLSWMHAGSHNAFDDAELNYSDYAVGQYKAVFEQVFEKNQQDQHYRMMMGEPVSNS